MSHLEYLTQPPYHKCCKFQMCSHTPYEKSRAEERLALMERLQHGLIAWWLVTAKANRLHYHGSLNYQH